MFLRFSNSRVDSISSSSYFNVQCIELMFMEPGTHFVCKEKKNMNLLVSNVIHAAFRKLCSEGPWGSAEGFQGIRKKISEEKKLLMFSAGRVTHE